MKKIIALAFPLALILALFPGCSSSSETAYDDAALPVAAPASPPSDMRYRDEVDAEAAYEYEESASMDLSPEEANIETGGSGEAGIAVQNISSDDRKIVKTITLSLQTTDFEGGTEKVVQFIGDFQGYIEDSYVEGSSIYEKYYTRSASYTARVPSDSLDAFLEKLDTEFHVVNQQQNARDISEEYYDTEARLKSLRTQEERLTEMLETAGELEYLIQVQQALSDVQYQIESITSSLRRMQNSVSMSTVHISLYEVTEYDTSLAAPTSFSQRIRYTVGDSWENFVSTGQDLLLALILLLPFLLVIAVVLIVVILILRSSRKRKRRKAEAKSAEAAPSIPEVPEQTPSPDAPPEDKS